MSVFCRIANLFSRSRAEREIDAELRSHIEMRIDDNIAKGMLPDDARRDAYMRFGNRTMIKERVAGEDAALVVENVWRDVRVACRQLSKSRSFTIPAMVTLALGIGANVATFSVVDAVMLRPLPYDHPEQLIDVVPMNSRFPQDYSHNFSYPDYFDFRAGNHTLAHLVSYHDLSYTMTSVGSPVHVEAEAVSWDLLPALGVQPQMGRGFLPEEEKPGSRVVLISHAIWVSEFARDPAIVGRSVHLSGEIFSIVGVMPPSFRFPTTAPLNGIWTTLAVDKGPADSSTTNRDMHFLSAIGRLKPGVSVALAEQDLSIIAAHLNQQYPATNGHIDSAGVRTELSALEMYLPSSQLSQWCCLHTVLRTAVEPRSLETTARRLVASMDKEIPVINVRTMQELMNMELAGPRFAVVLLGVFAALSVMLTVVGLYNVMTYSVLRRTREIGIRMALGAQRSQVLNKVLLEAGAMLAIGIAIGVLASLLSGSLFRSMLYGTGARNPMVLGLVSSIAAIAGLIAAFLPARRAASVDPMQALRGD